MCRWRYSDETRRWHRLYGKLRMEKLKKNNDWIIKKNIIFAIVKTKIIFIENKFIINEIKMKKQEKFRGKYRIKSSRAQWHSYDDGIFLSIFARRIASTPLVKLLEGRWFCRKLAYIRIRKSVMSVSAIPTPKYRFG